MADEEGSVKEEETTTAEAESGGDKVIGSAAIRPIFFANLVPNYKAEDVTTFFQHPPLDNEAGFEVDRIELKRGYCFVFIKDAKTQADKERIQDFVKKINGMYVNGVQYATARDGPCRMMSLSLCVCVYTRLVYPRAFVKKERLQTRAFACLLSGN